jgi:hypothetical protein
MNRNLFIWLSVILVFSGLTLHAQSFAEAEARDAIRRLEEALESSAFRTTQNAEQGATPFQPTVQETRGGQQPPWVRNPYAEYSRNSYLAAVGTGKNRREAELNAFSALISTFELKLESELILSSIYTEINTNGNVFFTDDTKTLETIHTAAKLDSLIGAEIRDVWDDDRGTVYALACMDREKTKEVYTQLIRLHQFNIDKLTGMTDAEKYTFEGYNRYKTASALAALNKQYVNVISVVGGSITSLNYSDASSLDLEASNILRNITISINVNGDNANRIQYAFSKIINGEGFKILEDSSSYILDVVLTLNETTVTNNRNSFCEYVITANLIENLSSAVLFSFNETNMVSDLSYERAADRAMRMVERLINEQFSVLFKEYIATVF